MKPKNVAKFTPKTPKTIENRTKSTIARLLLGSATTIGLAVKYNRFRVSCDAGRLAGW